MSEQDRQARNLVLNCATYKDAATLIDDVEALFTCAGIPVVSLGYGKTSGKGRGFVVVEYYQPLPGYILDKLNANPAIEDFVIYDAASATQEQAAKQEALLRVAAQQEALMLERATRQVTDSPLPPDGYCLLCVPTPLLRALDERWIALAQGPEGIGVLVYEHLRAIIFLIPDEAIVAYAVIGEQSRTFMEYLNPIDQRHSRLIEAIRAYWHMLQPREINQEGATE